MSYSLLYPLDLNTNYSYDQIKIEVITGLSQLVPILSGAEAYIYAKLDENQGLVARDSSGNQRDGAFQGGLDENDWVSGKIGYAIEGIGTSNGFINFDGFGNFVTSQAFTLECWIKFTSTASQNLVGKQLNTGNFDGYAITLQAGKPRLVIRDDSGNKIVKEHISTINDNSFHHVVFTYDGSGSPSGANLYVDNVVNNVPLFSETLTGSIINIADLQVSGRQGNNNTLDIGTVIDEVVVYDRELSPAEVSFRWNGGAGTQILPGATTAYATDNPIISPTQAQLLTEISSFSGNVNEVGSDSITFYLEVNGNNLYWDGSGWSSTTGYPNTNTIAEINSNLVALNTTYPGLKSIKWKAVLHSDDGTTTPQLLDVTLGLNNVVDDPILNTTIITGNRRGLDGVIRANETIQVRNGWIIGTNVITDDEFIDTITDSNGDWFISIKIEDIEPDVLEWRFGSNKIYKTNFVSGTIKFSDLSILWQSTDEIDTIGL